MDVTTLKRCDEGTGRSKGTTGMSAGMSSREKKRLGDEVMDGEK